MICRNCGAEYSDGNLQCPYCQSENKKMAARRKSEILKSYDEEAEKIREQAKQYPKKTVNKWTKYIFAGVGILVAAGLIITLIAILVNQVSSSHEYNQIQKHTVKLEEMFLANDYAALKEYIEEEKLYGREYEKYWQVQDAYTQCVTIEERIAYVTALESNSYKDRNEWEVYVEYDIKRILKGIERILFYYEQECRDDVFRGNEEALEKLCEQGLKMVEEFGFSKEELREVKLGNQSTEEEMLFQKLEDYFWDKRR